MLNMESETSLDFRAQLNTLQILLAESKSFQEWPRLLQYTLELTSVNNAHWT